MGFDFKSDWAGRDRFDSALRDLAEGRLPGKWGVVQQLVGHWAIPNNERGLVRYSKATLDSLGTIVSYRHNQKRVLDEGNDHCKEWLTENGYEEAFPVSSNALKNFLVGALKPVPFRKKKIRNALGETGNACLFEFAIDKDKFIYFYDSFGGIGPRQEDKVSKTSSFWDGPFAKEDDYDLLIQFIRKTIWIQLDSTTAILSKSQDSWSHQLKFDSYDPEFDFQSGNDTWNDVKAMAERCKAFLDNGQSRSMLFFGPPGTGKSTMARAIARELDVKVLIIDHEAIDQISNSSISKIISLIGPGLVVLNDVDRQDNSTASLLQSLEMHSDEDQYLVVLTVNDIKKLDPAILRPGRINEVRRIPEPTTETRRVILDYYMNKFGLSLKEEEINEFMENSNGFSPADVREFCETANAMGAELALGEIKRIEEQRKLYANDACEEFNGTREGRFRGKAVVR